jgi:NTE family protein
MKNTKSPKIGLCLSGGAALGYAHIGVIKALEENGIFPDVISGSSMGAIVGVLYAGGYSPEEITRIIQREKGFSISKIISPTFSAAGLSDQKVLRRVLHEFIPHNDFAQLKRQFFVCVSNLTTAQWEIIGDGDLLHEMVIASSSVPGIFEANQINENIYVDGSLFNNLPSQILKKHTDVIIGIDVLPYEQKRRIAKRTDVLALCIRAVEHQNALEGRALCDFLIESPAIEKYSELSMDKYMEIIEIGYHTTSDYLRNCPDILKRCAK